MLLEKRAQLAIEQLQRVLAFVCADREVEGEPQDVAYGRISGGFGRFVCPCSIPRFSVNGSKVESGRSCDAGDLDGGSWSGEARPVNNGPQNNRGGALLRLRFESCMTRLWRISLADRQETSGKQGEQCE